MSLTQEELFNPKSAGSDENKKLLQMRDDLEKTAARTSTRMTAKPIIYLDLETQRTADDAGGWDKLHKMGVSVAVALTSNELRVFTEKDIKGIVPLLESAKSVVGFNILRFDFKVLAGYQGIDLSKVKAVDMMVDVSEVSGHRIGIDALVEATLGITRDINGLDMVELWKKGRLEKVIEGCCNDVLMMKALHEYGCEHGKVFYYPEGSKRRKSIAVKWSK